jgi:aspartoacylase
MMASISTVAVTGGTHGNELTGVYLVRHWLAQSEEVHRGSFSTEVHLANPEAVDQVRRYINQDLNRQFNIHDLQNPGLPGCEQQRAKALNALLGPKEDPRVDFVIDMHTTTANMGMSLLFNSSDPLVVGMAFYIKQQMPDARLFFTPSDRLEDNYLRSMGRFGGLVIEVGPIAQGLLNHEVYAATHSAVMHGLDYLDKRNAGQPLALPTQMPGYRFLEKVPLPQDEEGRLCAMVHPELQGRDYQAIHPGDPLFITLSGDTIAYAGEKTVYGAFINEAAYYDRSIGLSFLEEVEVQLHAD